MTFRVGVKDEGFLDKIKDSKVLKNIFVEKSCGWAR